MRARADQLGQLMGKLQLRDFRRTDRIELKMASKTKYPFHWQRISECEKAEKLAAFKKSNSMEAWLPDGYSQIFRLHVFGPLGFWTMATLPYAAKFDQFLSLDCAPTPSTLEREGIKFCHLETLDGVGAGLSIHGGRHVTFPLQFSFPSEEGSCQKGQDKTGLG